MKIGQCHCEIIAKLYKTPPDNSKGFALKNKYITAHYIVYFYYSLVNKYILFKRLFIFMIHKFTLLSVVCNVAAIRQRKKMFAI